jgi:hypothetical protein
MRYCIASMPDSVSPAALPLPTNCTAAIASATTDKRQKACTHIRTDVTEFGARCKAPNCRRMTEAPEDARRPVGATPR